jgi:hypothetical protein
MRPINIVSRLLLFFIVLIIALNVQPVLFAQDTQAEPEEVAGAAPDESIPADIEKESVSPPEGSSGMKVYIDPETGEFLDSPHEKLPSEMPEAAKEAISTSDEGLEERKVDKPGGGVMIDLKGRFRQHQTATQDDDGNISIRCTPEAPLPTGNNRTDIHQPPTNDEQE